ncbi:DNA polymerase domain-containing protein [Chamaesiphon sp.]|uniref:DNA polymerase domain-containing protein n=1 Tax=Chamaesiphon sp. TaxID=2814140 RepID=UPI003592EFDE
MMDIKIGSIVYGKGGVGNPVTAIDNETLTIDTPNGLRLVNVTKILRVENSPSNPRDAISRLPGRIEVNLDRLSLDYQPTVTTPSWEPTTSVKPYEELTKIYLDIETTGLDPLVNRVLMVGLMSGTGEKVIITDPDEKVTLTRTIDYLKANKPDSLIGHNLINFDVPFIATRCRINKISHPFTKASKTARITSSSVNGQPIEFTPVYWKGTDILDTYHQIAIWDKAAAKLNSYGLKNSVIALGLRDERRLELSVERIRACWESGDVATIQEYLEFDLDDTQLLANFLLPVVYYQMNYVPNLNFQTLAIASPALKAQKIHQRLLPNLEPDADGQSGFDGGTVELLKPGLHQNVAKIDVSSLYPSIMLRYGICSRKDTENRFLGVLDYMRGERLRLKALGKQGDRSASFQEKALKVLINGSYGFFGTGYYSFNDYEAAALVTAYGRKILDLMVSVVESCGGIPIEIDTDGIFFSHDDPETVSKAVADALPDGIEIELELKHCGLYAPKAKSYVLVSPEGKTSVKGLFRKRNRYRLQNEFPTQFIKLYFGEGLDAASAYYQEIRSLLTAGNLPIEDLIITRKISTNEKNLVELGLGKPGDTVSYWYKQHIRLHAKTGRPLKPQPIETSSGEYWADYYVTELDEAYRSILGVESPLTSGNKHQLKLDLNAV